MTSDPIIPLWITVPIAMGLMIAVWLHAIILVRSDEPASRKRIRLANAAIMMLTAPLFAVGFSVIGPESHPREWAMTWMLGAGLLAIIIALAMTDAVNTMRLAIRTQRALRRHLHRSLGEASRTSPEPSDAAS